jgi:diacylglycerol kinase (ATP)
VRRGLLVYNPTAGQRDRRGDMSALIDRQRQRGLELVNAPTSGPGDATEIVKTFLPRGLDVVAVCGGDGTISEAARGLEGSAVPLAVLPGGTSNVLAIELGVPTALEKAEELFYGGEIHALRLAHADGRSFLLWAGAGLDARVMGNMRFAWKRLLGRAGIFPTAIREFLKYEFPRLEVTIDGAAYPATFAVACRASHYGGNWIIAPDARLDADHFDVLLFSHRSRRKLAALFSLMAAGNAGHLDKGLARIVRGRDVGIRSLDGTVEVQIDGDTVLSTPVSCRVGSETVNVLVPKRPTKP